MKKIILIIFITTLLFAGCSSETILSSNFNMDLEQVLTIIEKAHESELDFTESEKDLIDNFERKYKHGQYHVSKKEGYSEMNDLEKAIFNEVLMLRVYANDLEDKASMLESDKKSNDLYGESKEEIDRLMKTKNISNLPDEYKDKYPTYEVGKGIYPEQFEKDMRELIETFDPIVNGDETTINEDDSKILETIFEEYNINSECGPYEYEQNNKHYLVNSNMSQNLKTTIALVKDLNDGFISEDTKEQFNRLKEDMEIFGRQ